MGKFIDECLELFMVFCQACGVMFFTFAVSYLLDGQFTMLMLKFMWTVGKKLFSVEV